MHPRPAPPCLQVGEQLKPLQGSINTKALDQYLNFTEQRDDLVRRKQVRARLRGPGAAAHGAAQGRTVRERWAPAPSAPPS